MEAEPHGPERAEGTSAGEPNRCECRVLARPRHRWVAGRWLLEPSCVAPPSRGGFGRARMLPGLAPRAFGWTAGAHLTRSATLTRGMRVTAPTTTRGLGRLFGSPAARDSLGPCLRTRPESVITSLLDLRAHSCS